jgi:aryl-alcohol dehydrogenase-like predicted oxidoreductase
VPILCGAGDFDFEEKEILLRRSYELGVHFWDTSTIYVGGKSEKGIGKYFRRYPERRKDIFMCTKSDIQDAKGMRHPAALEQQLDRSLRRLKTGHIDLYMLHHVDRPVELTDEIGAWSEKMKKAGKIKAMGFSTHSNMAPCLTRAATCDWIDAIMTSYNFRHFENPEMQTAIDACHKADIGLIAMKAQASMGYGIGKASGTDSEGARLVAHFKQKGFSEGQAKLKAVWQDERFSASASMLPNLRILEENAAAAMDRTEMTAADMAVLEQYAQATCRGYCAGCAEICDSAMGGDSHVRDVMRYMMYYTSYRDPERARSLFAQIPTWVRRRLASRDYSAAEARCPQGLPIGEIMADAAVRLA